MRVAVRNFATEKVGDRIAAALVELGFDIEADGLLSPGSDSLVGRGY
jgi:hypothetical protein